MAKPIQYCKVKKKRIGEIINYYHYFKQRMTIKVTEIMSVRYLLISFRNDKNMQIPFLFRIFLIYLYLCFYFKLFFFFYYSGSFIFILKYQFILFLNILFCIGAQHIEKQRHYFANKGPSSQGYGFSCGHVWM